MSFDSLKVTSQSVLDQSNRLVLGSKVDGDVPPWVSQGQSPKAGVLLVLVVLNDHWINKPCHG